ncbi:hypothetical protein CHH26_05055 [Qipengyuania flava]|uniref:hypothetical protein n=1 Tax=Qipengyuania flava TaxID=192812 RepID=UPI000B8C017E|nr:hypothetical protein [Qipengyuania flava]ASP29669.1 hypothetical protein CHH26_05055 [Qipengyuania flava]
MACKPENEFHCIWENDTRTIEAVKLASIDRRFDRLAGATFERIAHNGMHCDLPWIRVTYEGAVYEAPLNAVEFIRLSCCTSQLAVTFDQCLFYRPRCLAFDLAGHLFSRRGGG